MTTGQVRQLYLNFFQSSPRNHVVIPAAALVPVNDPTTLFTSSGMQPLVPYLLGQPHPEGKRLVDSQPCFRAQDIDEVGDNRHTTFFEMLGNWSLGDYFKSEQLAWFFEFLTNKDEGLGLNPNKLYISVFGGDENFRILRKGIEQELLDDLESVDIWKKIFEKVGVDAKVANTATKTKLDIKNGRIFYYGVEKNWWSRSGTPQQMPVGEIGGPDSEVFYDFGEKWGLHEKSQWRNKSCHPNCDCGRFLEIGNSVFMQYKKIDNNLFEELPNKNVDFGGGLERLAAAVRDDPDIFKVDFFFLAHNLLKESSIESNDRSIRIILDHIRASIFLIEGGVEPSNKEQGYLLRRLIRRSALHAELARIELDPLLSELIPALISPYAEIEEYKGLAQNKAKILDVVRQELDKFSRTLRLGMKKLTSLPRGKVISGKEMFDFYQTYGYPLELLKEFANQQKIAFSEEGLDEARKAHQEKSRSVGAGRFKGGLADQSEAVTKLHTATHLLHAALRQILGSHVRQEGSNITAERLRFDFAYDEDITPTQIKAVEKLINDKIGENLPVRQTFEDKDKALASGALAWFREKYPDRVSVYTMGDFSRELCGGPHVASTGTIGSVKIDKVQAIGRGRKRIYATVCPIDQV